MLSTQDKSRIAANNNADLCAAIMAANGIRTMRDDIAYSCIDRPLPFYPKMVTLDPTATSEQGARIDGLGGIKDSFSCLDAELLGLRVAFEASWIWSEAHHNRPIKWVRVEQEDELSDWHQAWRGEGSPSDQVIFPPACLQNPKLAFFARVSGTKIDAGCIANVSEDVVGMSNVFSTTSNDQRLYEESLSVVSSFGGDRPVVGYEQGADLDLARSAGFQVIGPLRLLVK